MSPVTLQVVQDSPSGYLVSTGAPDSFLSPLKSRGKRDDNDESTKSHHQRGSGTGEGTQETSVSDGGYSPASSTGCESSIQSSQGSFTSSSTTTTSTTSTTISTSATGSGPTPTASIPSPSASSSYNSASSTVSSTQAKTHKGAIIGGIVGGVVIFSIAALILFIFLRRRRRMKHTAPSAEFLHPNSPFQRLNTAGSRSPTRTRSVFDMLPSPNSGDAGRKSLLRSLSRRDYKAPPTLEKVTVDTTSAVHAL